MKRFAFVVVAVLALGSGACGSSTDAGASGSGGSGGSTGSGGSAGTGGSSGGCSTSCDDGKSCTVDSCNAGTCTHTIGPNTGSTACPTGQFCTVEKGCVASPPCATVTDCTNAWTGDACKANIKCDAASSVCMFDVLDKDHDGYPPPACGGGDCDDANPAIHPGAVEKCDGIDNDCNGLADDKPAADEFCSKDMGALYSCSNGACACNPANECGAQKTCVDLQTSPSDCGKCGHSCPGVACVAGVCDCPNGDCTSLLCERWCLRKLDQGCTYFSFALNECVAQCTGFQAGLDTTCKQAFEGAVSCYLSPAAIVLYCCAGTENCGNDQVTCGQNGCAGWQPWVSANCPSLDPALGCHI